LQYKINDLTDSEKEIEVILTYDEVKSDIEAEVKKQTKDIQLPGFRKGKVPLSMIKKMYGDALEYEASEKIANAKFWEVSEEKGLKPVGQPTLTDIKFKPGENLSFKVKYEVVPQIDVKDYTGLEVELPFFEVKEDDIEHELKHILKSNSTTGDTEIIGDHNNFLINVDVQRVDENGNPVESSKPETLDIDLSNERVNSEIIENSRGKKVGDSFSFSFKDEKKVKKDDGSEEDMVENFSYTAKINSIKEIKLPEINEEFVKKITKDKLSSEAELRDGIRKDVQNYYDQKTDEFLRNRLLQLIVEKNDFKPPQTLVRNVLDELIKQEEENQKKSGYGKFNRQEAEKYLYKSAEMEVKWFLIKNAILKKEGIEITDDELKELAKNDAVKTGLPEEKLVNYYKSSNMIEKLSDKKLFDFLKEKTKIKKVKPEDFKNKEVKENK
jgi:trigger factor